MKNAIFREKSMNRIMSPEQMNDYIRVSNPSVWMILLSVILLLAGICVWGIFGSLDTTVKTGGVCSGGILTCYLSETDYSRLQAAPVVTVEGEEYPAAASAGQPVRLGECADEYLVHLTGLKEDDWVYELTAQGDGLKDGVYSVSVILNRVRPMEFVFN